MGIKAHYGGQLKAHLRCSIFTCLHRQKWTQMSFPGKQVPQLWRDHGEGPLPSACVNNMLSCDGNRTRPPPACFSGWHTVEEMVLQIAWNLTVYGFISNSSQGCVVVSVLACEWRDLDSNPHPSMKLILGDLGPATLSHPNLPHWLLWGYMREVPSRHSEHLGKKGEYKCSNNYQHLKLVIERDWESV